MTLIRQVTVTCDSCGRRSRWGVNAAQARRFAKEDGFVRWGSDWDVCDRCKRATK